MIFFISNKKLCHVKNYLALENEYKKVTLNQIGRESKNERRKKRKYFHPLILLFYYNFKVIKNIFIK